MLFLSVSPDYRDDHGTHWHRGQKLNRITRGEPDILLQRHRDSSEFFDLQYR